MYKRSCLYNGKFSDFPLLKKKNNPLELTTAYSIICHGFGLAEKAFPSQVLTASFPPLFVSTFQLHHSTFHFPKGSQIILWSLPSHAAPSIQFQLPRSSDYLSFNIQLRTSYMKRSDLISYLSFLKYKFNSSSASPSLISPVWLGLPTTT